MLRLPSRHSATPIVFVFGAALVLAACKQQERKDPGPLPGESTSGTGDDGFTSSGDASSSDTSSSDASSSDGSSGSTSSGSASVGSGGSANLEEACASFCARATELGCDNGCVQGCALTTTCIPETIAYYDCAVATPDYLYCDGDVLKGHYERDCKEESEALGDCI